ncbi:cbb3-type cytochrome oxidase assembly protein CcoS [Teichococcus aestuarii]
MASATALERLAGAGHVVLDKTGTLTEGRPVLLEEPGRPPRRCARRRRWRGPRATRWRARWWRPAPTRPRAGGRGGGAGPGPPPRRCAGGGPEGETRLGSAPFIGLPQEDEGLTLWLARPGLSPVPFRFADRLREDAAPAVAALRELGLEAELLSGDAPPAVEAAAHATGIGPWQARATPEGKAERIAALSVAGHRPLMVGDGINDAAALALAHVSATPQGATDLAQGAADLVLRGEGLGALPYAIRVARRAQRPGAAEYRLQLDLQHGRGALRGAGIRHAADRGAGDGLLLHHRHPQCAARREGEGMSALLLLVPLALFLGGLALLLFLWTLRARQYDDLDGAAARILYDDLPSKPRDPR